LADVAQLTRLPTVAQERRYLATKAEDVEDWAVAVITFEDGTKATVHSNDTTLGGVRNVVTAYLTNGVVHANINPNTTVAAYAPTAPSGATSTSRRRSRPRPAGSSRAPRRTGCGATRKSSPTSWTRSVSGASRWRARCSRERSSR